MTDVFLSYASDDRPRAQVIAQALEQRGFVVWWDRNLVAGQNFSQVIAKQLAQAKAVVVLWSNASLSSQWVPDEAAEGRKRNALIPVLIDKVEPPLGFRSIHTEDLSDWPRSGDQAFEKLVRALEELSGAEALPAPEKRRQRIPQEVRRIAIPAAIVVALALAFILGPRVWIMLSEPPPPAQQPGALGPNYGLTDTDFATLPLQALAAKALEKTTIDQIEADAIEGNDTARALLCAATYTGQGAPQDFAAAESRCATALEAGAPLGGYVLSLMAREGRVGPPDPARADQLLRQAADAGEPRAQRDLAAANPKEARPQLEKCAAAGNQDCAFELAMSRRAESEPEAKAIAVAALRELSDAFYGPAARELGRMHLTGEGLARSDAQAAADLFKRAELLGDAEASYELGKLAEAGKGGLPRSVGQALEYFEKAEKAGYAPAKAEIDRIRGGSAPATP